MLKSKLPNSVLGWFILVRNLCMSLIHNLLGKIWKLADVDKDGQLDSDEFALASYLINLKLEGHELPIELPKHLIPPSKRSEAEDGIYPAVE